MEDARVLKWLSEELNVEERTDLSESEDSDIENLVVNESDNTEREISADELELNEEQRPYYLGRDNITKWNIHAPPRNRRRAKRNIVIHPPGVKGEARNKMTPTECFHIFFPDDVIEEIVQFTNIQLRKFRVNYARESDTADTNIDELKAVIGLLYLAGMLKSSHTNIQDLWCTDGTAPENFRLVMRYNRFYILLRALRFDDIRTRAARKAVDKLAPIRNLFEGFVQRCKSSYSVSEYVTIDEMLESFRGRCSFRRYLPNKPAKYGILIYALVDARMFYTSNMEIYAGVQPDGPFSTDYKPYNVVQRMIEPINGSGRNITMDNWFSSVNIVNDLVREQNITVVATIRKNKRELPPEIVNTRSRPENSSLFAFGEKCMIVSYVPKKYRNVILISSMHDSDDIDDTTGDLMKPEVNTFYNSTKGGVDVVDELKSRYSVARVCFRWPLRIFFTLLDVAGINAQIIHESNTGEENARRIFLKNLALELTKKQMIVRAGSSGLHTELRTKLQTKLNIPSENPETQQCSEKKRVKCGFCPKKKNRKTTVKCSKCSVAICGEHTVNVCKKCFSINMSEDSD